MKSYIGKTKSRYGKKDFGGNCRFKQHLVNAFSPSKYDDCPLCKNNISMEEKFKIALDYKEQLYKTYVKITKTSSKEDRDNPQPST
jgi:hypothetical protein